MQIRLPRLLPPEKALLDALSEDAKTKRLCKIILYSAIPVVLTFACLILLAAACDHW